MYSYTYINKIKVDFNVMNIITIGNFCKIIAKKRPHECEAFFINDI